MEKSKKAADRKYAKLFYNFNVKYSTELLAAYLRKCQDKYWFAFI